MASGGVVLLRDELVEDNPTATIVENLRWFFIGYLPNENADEYLEADLIVENQPIKTYLPEEEIFVAGNNPQIGFSSNPVGIYDFRCLSDDPEVHDNQSEVRVIVNSVWKDGNNESWNANDGSDNIVPWFWYEVQIS